MKKRKSVIMRCEKCGCIPEPDKEKSNGNWKVYPSKCPKCGGEIMPYYE